MKKIFKFIRKLLGLELGQWIYAPSTESVRNFEQAERNRRAMANYYTRSYNDIRLRTKQVKAGVKYNGR